MIMTKINIVIFFCNIHIILFRYFCFCSVQLRNLQSLLQVHMKHYSMLPQIRIYLRQNNSFFASWMFVFYFFVRESQLSTFVFFIIFIVAVIIIFIML